MPETALSHCHYKTICNSLCFLLQPSRTAVNTIKSVFFSLCDLRRRMDPFLLGVVWLVKNLIYLIYLSLYDCPNKMSMCCTAPATGESVVLNSFLSFVLLFLCVVKEGKLTQLFHICSLSDAIIFSSAVLAHACGITSFAKMHLTYPLDSTIL